MTYDKFIQNILDTRGRFGVPAGEYKERHHIIPKCLGGTNPPINVVKCPGCGWRHEQRESITYVPFPVDEAAVLTINREEMTIDALGL